MSEVRRFYDKASTVEAIQFTGDNGVQINVWSLGLFTASGDVLMRKREANIFEHHDIGTWVFKRHGAFYTAADNTFTDAFEAI